MITGLKADHFRAIYNKYKDYPSSNRSKNGNDMLHFVMSWYSKQDREMFEEVNNVNLGKY